LRAVLRCKRLTVLAKIRSRGSGGAEDDERVKKAFRPRSEVVSVKAITYTIWVLFLEIVWERSRAESTIWAMDRGTQAETAAPAWRTNALKRWLG
jgi:hypothetical protein